MPPEIAAIKTTYNGIEFRSRLEARWAVFFDTLGVRYFYEYEGFKLSSYYVPDFFLPDVFPGTFVEIKPNVPTRREDDLCRELAVRSGKKVVLQFGLVAAEQPEESEFSAYQYSPHAHVLRTGGYKWCECPVCKKIGIEMDGYAENVCGLACTQGHFPRLSSRVIQAYRRAQIAKFW